MIRCTLEETGAEMKPSFGQIDNAVNKGAVKLQLNDGVPSQFFLILLVELLICFHQCELPVEEKKNMTAAFN